MNSITSKWGSLFSEGYPREDGCIVCNQQGISILEYANQQKGSNPCLKRKNNIGKSYEQTNKDTEMFKLIK